MNQALQPASVPPPILDEAQARIELAAAFRLAVRFDWHEAVANHFSLSVSEDGRRFLLNPRWRHFSRVRASELLLLDADDPGTMQRPGAPDETAWRIHGRIHALLPQARCVLHLHTPYATALASLQDPEIKPIEQNTARYWRRVAYDRAFTGMATTDDEGERLARILGDKRVLMMGNHGVLTAAPTVAEAFDLMYYLERACRTLVLAYSTGQPLSVMTPEVAERTAQDWDDFGADGAAHFHELKALLDREEPDYAD
jgi:ribulose-5-phosphate 4-epimerase/fuculose-1-phosphate aldolase